MSLHLSATNSIKVISEEEELQKQTETIKKFFKNRISVTFQAKPVFQESYKVIYTIPDMQQNKECLENDESSVISTSTDHSKYYDKLKVKILVPKLKKENEEVEKIKCIECEYFAKTKRSLHNHIKIEHKGFTYDCNKCEFQTKYSVNLSRHIENEHERKVHNCKQCQSTFKGSDSLRKHVREKHEGRKYPCTECDYLGASSYCLKVHRDGIHLGMSFVTTFHTKKQPGTS